ncbi:UNVERIFIED_CONTAM: ABC-type lipoprotein export system ATPase subunit [Acetivibrio alkalicellulosi]
MFNEIQVSGGYDKDGNSEKISYISFERGNVYSIVGKTGSGKTQLIEDIESLNNGEGLTKRIILIDGKLPDEKLRNEYRSGFIAHLSQNMNYILDMPVIEFLKMRQKLKTSKNKNTSPEEILDTANELAGEKIKPHEVLTRLSGGQGRSLMISDVALNNEAPVILIDEIENAGIDKVKALSLLTKKEKITLIITHDPLIALHGNKRIVMQNGGIYSVIDRSEHEKKLAEFLAAFNKKIDITRELIRTGKTLKGVDEFVLHSVLE